MQFLIIILLISFNVVFANSPTVMNDLFGNYLKVIQNTDSVPLNLVFTKTFIKNAGGEKQLKNTLSKIRKLSPPPKSLKIDFKKGSKDGIYLVKILNAKETGTKFVIITEDGKYKIDETVNSED